MENNSSAQVSHSNTADQELMQELCINNTNVDNEFIEQSDSENSVASKETSHEETISESTNANTDTSTVTKQEKCCICGAEAVYRCPGCGRRTCSLTCVRVHKVDHACPGTREISTHVPLHEYNDTQLERDFTFLEDCRRVIDNATRLLPRTHCRFTFKHLPAPLAALRQAAKKRGVICQLVSVGMHRREANTSRYDKATDTIIWHCDFHFVCSNNTTSSFTIATDWGSERFRLCDVLQWCWATNPPLPSFHINRRYNKSTEYTKEQTSTTLKKVRNCNDVNSSSSLVVSDKIEETSETNTAAATTKSTTEDVDGKDDAQVNENKLPQSLELNETREHEEEKSASSTAIDVHDNNIECEQETLTLKEETQDEEEKEEQIQMECESESDLTDVNHDNDNCSNAENDDDTSNCATQHNVNFHSTEECDLVNDKPNEKLELPSEENDTGNYHKKTNNNDKASSNVCDERKCNVPSITITPMTDEEKTNEARVNEFMSNLHLRSPEESANGRTCEDDIVILCQAEHLNGDPRYFHMKPNETLNENMRLLFFVNEYPVFTIIHARDLHKYTLMTLEDKLALRESLRPKPRVHEDKSKHIIPEITELSEEEKAKLTRIPCKHFLHGKCNKESNCPYWHCTREEVPVCRQYARNKRCPLGNRCLFRHDASNVCNSSNNNRNNNKYNIPRRGALASNATMKRSRTYESTFEHHR